MKRKLAIIALVLSFFFVLSSFSYASNYQRNKDDYPVRWLAYVAHPFGMAADYLIARPIHWIVKQTDLNTLFGSEHKPEDVSFKWE